MSVLTRKIEVLKINTGVYWVSIPEVDLRILCGCPADTVKHLKKRGLIEDIEKDGVQFESGPNAILLSDVDLQNGFLCNLAEFPLLQMLYSQGMLLPNHPNNTGAKPVLLGSKPQIQAQLEYFYRGNYGLISKEEILETGVSEELAEHLMHIKLKFAFGKLKPSHEMVDQIPIEKEEVEIREGVQVRRKDVNVFEIQYLEDEVTIDLNLRDKEAYEPPYNLNYHRISRDYFSIVHTGEGDAWDVNNPCMASIVVFQGKIYLVDAGPDMLTSLTALGISINEVEGIFHTHLHDDHFAGLTAFVRSDHRIKYYATPLVRSSVAKKLCVLLSLPEESFNYFFDVQDLELNAWNNIEGLEVKPVLSPHPVETNIYYFRAYWGDRYYTYGHLADITSFRVLEQNIYPESSPFATYMTEVKTNYLMPADLKKIDIGGGLIHGEAQDFIHDPTPKKMLAHISRPLSSEEREIGSYARFGSTDELIPTHNDFLRTRAFEYLRFYFPDVPVYEIYTLLNCPIVNINAGDTLFKKSSRVSDLYLILTGAVELVYPDIQVENYLTSGSLVGFYIDENDMTTRATCQATSYVSALKIPAPMYLLFIKRHQLVEAYDHLERIVLNLSNSTLFQENISLPIFIRLAKYATLENHEKGGHIRIADDSGLYIVKNGQAALLTLEGTALEDLKSGQFFGAETRFTQGIDAFEVFFLSDTELYYLPMEVVLNIPIVYWKIIETVNRRVESLK